MSHHHPLAGPALIGLLFAAAPFAAAQETGGRAPLPTAPAAPPTLEWPPAPPLAGPAAAPEAASPGLPLPPSISVTSVSEQAYRCTFHYSPAEPAQRVVLVGSFNRWDPDTDAMLGPDAQGAYSASVTLAPGVYEYKFVVNGDVWVDDASNPQRLPDGYGGHNSLLRLGRLAHLPRSTAQAGDGQIDAVGLAHEPPRALYTQPLGAGELLLRYRTLAHDVAHVAVAVHNAAGGSDLTEMTRVSLGPLFAYDEARLHLPEPAPRPAGAGGHGAGPRVWSVEYTFVLDDGAGPVSDPHTYRYSFTETGLFTAPDWARDAVWYQIVPDRFRNGDPSNDRQPVRPWTSEWFTPSPWEGQDGQTLYRNFVFDRQYGGDLAGLEAELPYLKDLGVNALYLTPVFSAPSYHKYDVQNYLHIDPHLGGGDDYDRVTAQEDLLDPATWQWTVADQRFLAFLKTAHGQGFRVILDAVFNHVGAQHPAFLDVQKNGKRSRYADWFHVTSWQPFAYKGWAGFAHMPVFKKQTYGFASPDLKRHLFDVTRRWLDPNGDGDPSDGIDGWRLDVPDEIPHPFWAEWRRLVKGVNPQAFITGEVWQRAEDWLDGQHFDAVMNYEFAKTAVQWLFDRTTAIGPTEAAARFAELRLIYPRAATFGLQNLIDSHDTDRLASMAFNPDRLYDRQNRVQDQNPEYRNDRPDAGAYARARLAALLQMTYVGTPLIYYGDEVGLWGADDPSSRKPMLWKDLEPYDQPDVNRVMEDQLAFYRQTIALRRGHPALRDGLLTSLLTDDAANVWAFARSDAAETLIVVLNASEAPQRVTVPVPGGGAGRTWQGVLGVTGPVAAAGDGGSLAVAVPALSGVVLHAPAE